MWIKEQKDVAGTTGAFLYNFSVPEVRKANAAKLDFEEILCVCVQLVNVNKTP
jgi:hypothetical protein